MDISCFAYKFTITITITITIIRDCTLAHILVFSLRFASFIPRQYQYSKSRNRNLNHKEKCGTTVGVVITIIIIIIIIIATTLKSRLSDAYILATHSIIVRSFLSTKVFPGRLLPIPLLTSGHPRDTSLRLSLCLLMVLFFSGPSPECFGVNNTKFVSQQWYGLWTKKIQCWDCTEGFCDALKLAD